MGNRRLVDLSHVIESGMTTYPGLPGPVVSDFLKREDSRSHYAPGVEFHIGRLEMVANTGTYLDTPYHRYAGGKDLADTPLEWVAGLDVVVVRIKFPVERAIGPMAFEGLDMANRAVLVHTGWDIHWGTDRYYSGYPFLSAAAASHLVEAGASLVGIDSLNIDDDRDPRRPAHSILLGAEIPIVEHLCNLNAVPDTGATLFAAPPKIRGLGSFPLRVFCVLEESHDD